MVKKMYYRVVGFTDAELPNMDAMFDRMDAFVDREEAFRQRMIETEDNFCSCELVLLQDLTSSVLSYLDALLPQEAVATTAPVNFNGVTDIQASLDARHREVENTWEHAFHAGADNTSCLQLVNNPELCAGILNIYGYIGENADRIDELAQVSRDCFETYITDAKWEEGWKHVAVGAFAIMSGVGALGVAAATGSGAVLTVLGYASGTASGVFGSMELFEGMQNVTISLNGMKYTDAINPLKSAMGEDAYNMGLTVSTLTADAVTGVGAVKHWLQKHHGSMQVAEVAEKAPKGVNVTVVNARSKIGCETHSTLKIINQRSEFTGTNREKLLAMIENRNLRELANQLYREGATIGDGGTADILRNEFISGNKKHLIKAKERLQQIRIIIKKENLGLNDLDIAEALRDDLENAIALFEY